MTGIELHADFDRDGVITGNPTERSARTVWPGVVVVPNLDNDRRRLPSRVNSGAIPPADYDMATVWSRDDELIPIQVRVTLGALGSAERLRLRCSGIMHTRITLSDSLGQAIPQQLGRPNLFELPSTPANGRLNLTLQVRTVAGASFGRQSNLDATYQADAREETNFSLVLQRVDVLSVSHDEDEGYFSVAPFIIDDGLSPVSRLYIVPNTHNVPSVSDIRRSLRSTSVPLVEVSSNISGGDTWLQDQYQSCFFQGVNGYRSLILHLPRLRHENSDATITDNLEDFVDSHFRSRNVGLLNGLWDRVISVQTLDGGVLQINFRQLTDWAKRARRILYVSGQLNRFAVLVSSNWHSPDSPNWIDALRGIKSKLVSLNEVLDTAAISAGLQQTALIEGFKVAAQQLVQEVLQEFSVVGQGSNAGVRCQIASVVVTLSNQTALRLAIRSMQMNSAANYGGNIESTPPCSDAPLGKVIIGNAQNPGSGAEFVDPDLLRLLAKQKKQPIVEIDTTWLKVGHVDEVMAIVPSGRSGFSVLHASSAAAMTLLRFAEIRYRQGLPRLHPNNITGVRRPSGVLSRLMNEGSSPVTRLFRGKSWVHLHPPAQSGELGFSQEPPNMYLKLANGLGGGGFNVHDIGYVPGEGPVRRYPADISVSELIWADRDRAGLSCNTEIDSTFLEASRSILSQTLGQNAIPLPVIWDSVDDVEQFKQSYWDSPTTAFSPDVVNLQQVNGHLMIPKPYGPRMKPVDAILVVRQAMESLNIPGGIKNRVGMRIISRNHMTHYKAWVEKVDQAVLYSRAGSVRASFGGLRNKQDVINAFRDSFPGESDTQIEAKIIRPNRRHFDGSNNLRNQHSRLVINDGLVDLFELFTLAITDFLGVRAHFVDSWSYHIGDGQIHCGTNVLRQPRRVRVANVWDVNDTEFRSTGAGSQGNRVSGS